MTTSDCRAMHPEFACHSVFDPRLDGILEAIWHENSANLAWRLSQLAQDGALQQPPRVVLREMLALAMGHSKSKVPTDVLIDRHRLRQTMTEVASTDLHYLYQAQYPNQPTPGPDETFRQQADQIPADPQSSVENNDFANVIGKGDQAKNPHLSLYYQGTEESFAWLTSDHPAVRELASDAIDTVRVLRCADSLRQRGQVLKTSGGNEIFVSQQTARAIFSFQSDSGKLFLFESDNPVSAGEANIASSEIDADCNLRIGFHRGLFNTAEATNYAVHAAALVVESVQQDAIGSFRRPTGESFPEELKSFEDMQILLEETDDSFDFATRVREQIEAIDPALRGCINLAPSLNRMSDRERTVYLKAGPIAWDGQTRREFLHRLEQAGNRIEEIDLDKAFQDVKIAELKPGEILIEAGTPAAFVYIPMSGSLKVSPLGGYEAFTFHPWRPLGATGAIRGAERNATVVAETNLTLIIIPKAVYLREWYHPHTVDSFLQAIASIDD